MKLFNYSTGSEVSALVLIAVMWGSWQLGLRRSMTNGEIRLTGIADGFQGYPTWSMVVVNALRIEQTLDIEILSSNEYAYGGFSKLECPKMDG